MEWYDTVNARFFYDTDNDRSDAIFAGMQRANICNGSLVSGNEYHNLITSALFCGMIN